MKTFSLPPADTGADNGAENGGAGNGGDGAPDRIEHAAEYMFNAPGQLEFYYNFLIYSWTIDGATVSARAYLDDIQEVSVFAAPDKLETPAFAPLLRYLQRRYRVIKTFGDGSYQVRYKRG